MGSALISGLVPCFLSVEVRGELEGKEGEAGCEVAW